MSVVHAWDQPGGSAEYHFNDELKMSVCVWTYYFGQKGEILLQGG